MVDLVIVGSVALDTVKTPFGKVERILGGSASYASYSASFFAKPGIVGVVGADFPQEHLDMLAKHNVDLEGIEKSEGKTFFWEGYYEYDMNEAHTVKTELNCFADFKPKIPDSYKNKDFLFLGNIHPSLQLEVLDQMEKRPKLVVSDTMNFWIESERDKVIELVKESDIVLFNEGEARMLFQTPSTVKAAKEILKLDSDLAIIKQGEHGSVLFTKDSHFSAPGYPLDEVLDPTGAGDTFAGAMIGYLSQHPELSETNFRKSMIYASAVASHTAQGFSLNKLQEISMEQINARFNEFKKIVEF